jgi:hypothetical protein
VSSGALAFRRIPAIARCAAPDRSTIRRTAEVAEIRECEPPARHDRQMALVRLFGTGRFNDPSGSLADRLQKTGQAVAQRLQNWNADDLLNTPAGDVVDELLELASVRCPELLAADAYLLDPTEIDQQYRDWGETRTRRVMLADD